MKRLAVGVVGGMEGSWERGIGEDSGRSSSRREGWKEDRKG